MCASLVAERSEASPVARPTAPELVVRVHGLDHYYGEGEARNQVLFGNSIEIPAGQLVVMTGPSGAGKTTLLTLIGALRSAQEGRIDVLGRDLSQLGGSELVEVRRDIGFIFQMHNLFDALSAYENVKMAAQLADGALGETRQRCAGILEPAGRDRPRSCQSSKADPCRRADRGARQGFDDERHPSPQADHDRLWRGRNDGHP